MFLAPEEPNVYGLCDQPLSSAPAEHNVLADKFFRTIDFAPLERRTLIDPGFYKHSVPQGLPNWES